MLETVKSWNEIINNSHQFMKIIENNENKTFERFSRFSHWYYFPNEGTFAPNKFLRYKETTLENYIGDGHGNSNDKTLIKYFIKENEDSPIFECLFSKLKMYAKKIGGNLNSSVKIYCPRNEFIYYEYNKDEFIYNDNEESYFIEGKEKQISVKTYERAQDARRKCIEHYGYNCFACGEILSNKYGEIGKNFIHVHHIVELSVIKKEHNVDPIKDLRPLCPNCHAIIHRKSPALEIEELILLIKQEKL